MAAVESQMLALGTTAPNFTLADPDGREYSLRDGSIAHLVMFICNHCPFVKNVREELARIGNEYLPKHVAIYAINSNDASAYPGDSPAMMREESRTWGYSFPYLVDTDQSVAESYRATCTPDFFLFDKDRRLVYRGQLDGSRPSNDIAVDGRDLRSALDRTIAGTRVSGRQVPSIGCSIKWIPGHAPEYAG